MSADVSDYDGPAPSWSTLDSGLYADGTTGHSGSSTSAERAVRETLSPRRQEVYDVVASRGQDGITCAGVQNELRIGHGSASGALTVLHRGGNITRLTERRKGQEVYVLPSYVRGREESPYRPNSGKSRIAELEAALSSARQVSNDMHHILASGYADMTALYGDLAEVRLRLDDVLGIVR